LLDLGGKYPNLESEIKKRVLGFWLPNRRVKDETENSAGKSGFGFGIAFVSEKMR